MSVSRILSRRARECIPHGVNSPVRHYDPYPFFVRRSEGSRIWDADGQELIDMCNGYGALLLGHRHPAVIRAVIEQMEKGTLFCIPTELEVYVSELLCHNYPSVDMARMVNSGGEATMAAIRLARSYTGNPKIVMFEGGYHGAHDSVLAKAGSGSAHMGISSSAGVLPDISRHTIMAKYNDISGLADILETRQDVAGVIMEPVMANMGLVPPGNDFLQQVRHMTMQQGVPLIFDEVVTGFRMSPGGSQSYYSVTPDMTTLAKALGNGFAVAAIGGKRAIMEDLAPGGPAYQASTFGGNPIAAAAAISSINTINRTAAHLYPRLERYCDMVAKTIRDVAADNRILCQVNNISSMLQVFFTDHAVQDYVTAKKSDTARFRTLFDLLLAKGVFVAPSQYETVFLSGAMTSDDIDKICESYQTSLESMRT